MLTHIRVSESMLFMRILIALLVLVLNLQSWTKADDIRDFQIEGMSVGDSALDYYKETELNNLDQIDYLKDNEFLKKTIHLKKSDYDSIGLTFKPKDKKYIIYAINGAVHIDNNEQCLIKRNNIIEQVSKMFKGAEIADPGKRNYAADPTGESKSYSTYYWIKGAFIEISCYDLTEKLANANNWIKNTLNVGVSTKEFSDFLLTKQYSQ